MPSDEYLRLVDCSYPDGHIDEHRPHPHRGEPDIGDKLICGICHPVYDELPPPPANMLDRSAQR